jgi:hypothetical protein
MFTAVFAHLAGFVKPLATPKAAPRRDVLRDHQ